MKRIYKFATGDTVPEGAVFLSTIIHETTRAINDVENKTTRLVYHYFLVDGDPS